LDAEHVGAGVSLVLGLGNSLHSHPEADGIVRLRSPQDAETPISATDPAVRLVTDFTRQQPATVLEHVPIDVALEHMKTVGVRALLVLRDDVVTGLITSYDIQSSRVARFQHSANITRREDVEVGEIMSPWDQVPVLDWQYIQRAKVRDIASTFARFAGSHVVVVEHPAPGQTFVRGVISRTRLNSLTP
jgi:hypothetical protein